MKYVVLAAILAISPVIHTADFFTNQSYVGELDFFGHADHDDNSGFAQMVEQVTVFIEEEIPNLFSDNKQD